MKRQLFSLCAGVMLLAAACASMTTTPVDTVSGLVRPVVARHDAYIATAAKDDPKAPKWLAESATLLEGLRAAESRGMADVPNAAVWLAAKGVCDRHDAWVASDASLDSGKRRVYLRSTALLRELVGPPSGSGGR